ncbi:MAG: hypothetical protein ACTHXA_09525 [Gulosibacter sp.]|uniref:hypothetical protein n=1 Tax=Gulosibacter sp. TaxID=2817531 RepID=UPI003F9267C6
MQEFGGASSIALALVVLLGVGMLAPSWVREHNARSSQRNAIRLQQTLRAMASTSEVPEVVTLEAKARTVHAKRKELRKVQQIEAEAARAKARAEAERRETEARLGIAQAEQELRESQLRAESWRLAAEAREARLEEERKAAEEEMADANARREAAARARAAAAAAAAREAAARPGSASAADRWANGASGAERAVERRLTGEQPTLSEHKKVTAAARRRRGRLTATSFSGAGLIAAVIGIVGLTAGWGLALLIIGVAVLTVSSWMLVRINSVWKAQLAARAEVPVARAATEPVVQVAPEPQDLVIYDVEPEHVAAAAAPDDAWTPVPVPRPLYLDRAHAQTPPGGPDSDGPKVTDAEIMELLREEARKSAQNIRDAQADVPTLPNRAVAEPNTPVLNTDTTIAELDTPEAERIQPITVNSASAWSEIGDLDALVGEYGEGELANLDSVLRRRRAS